jgi:hypothetical protein
VVSLKGNYLEHQEILAPETDVEWLEEAIQLGYPLKF